MPPTFGFDRLRVPQPAGPQGWSYRVFHLRAIRRRLLILAWATRPHAIQQPPDCGPHMKQQYCDEWHIDARPRVRHAAWMWYWDGVSTPRRRPACDKLHLKQRIARVDVAYERPLEQLPQRGICT